MFSITQAVIFSIASVVTFFSYQVIPSALESRDFKPGAIRKIVHSAVFTMFIRYCGVDHMVMAIVMVGSSTGILQKTPALGVIICVSASVVAVVSAMSAVAVRANSERVNEA